MPEAFPRNFVTLLTPPGVGALAVVRISGPRVGEFLGYHFSRPCVVGRCIHGTFRDGERVIDDPVVVLGDGDGGKFADISLHGGPWVVQRTIELATRFGFDPSPDAATVDATNALERDVLASLPLARTDLALRVLLAQPGAWAAARNRCNTRRLELAANDRSLENLLRLPRVAIVGAPNVGKSTLANALFGAQRSITADLPGTTRDWVGEVADVDGLAVLLMDTPGVRQTKDPIESRAIDLAMGETRTADLVMVVLDAARPLNEQTSVLGRYPGAVVVLNKADLPCTWRTRVCVDVATIAHRGGGVTELRRVIATRFDCATFDVTRPRCWTIAQRAIVQRARKNPATLAELWSRSTDMPG
jgi:tRNA modification GTPase